MSSHSRHGLRVRLPFVTIGADAALGGSWSPQGTVAFARHRILDATRANIDVALIHGLPVASNGWLLWQGEVGLDLLDLFGLAGIGVDDGLNIE